MPTCRCWSSAANATRSARGKRLGDLADALRGAGLRQVTLKTYPEARHELFNESNRDAVTQDLIDWLD